MKRLFTTLLFIIAVPLVSHSQVITVDPEFPIADEAVTITFDATEGTGGLQDHNGDIYAHTGVITEKSTSDSDWKYVVADWDENVSKAKLERVGTNLYKLEITPSIREYYGVPQDEVIQQMAFVFRNSDGTKEGKAEGGEDIFADVYQNKFNVKFTQPADPPSFHKKSTTVSIEGIASTSDSNVELTLFIDGQQLHQVNDDTLQYNYTTQSEGNFELLLKGTDGTNDDEVTQQLVVNPDINEQNRPANLQDGITYVDDTTVRLSLFAPHKEFVYLIGDFNNWQIDPNYFMNRETVNADSSYYWIEINGLTPGEEYSFQYFVDGEIKIADPYSEKILDPYNDQYISSETYPNLKQYPSGQNFITGVLQPGKSSFNWQHVNYDRPDKENLVIYELLVRDFIENHDYKTLTDTLDYLDRLGVNAIELMPVMEFDANSSWGYNPTFHLAADKYYGPAEDLKTFIDEAHSRGIAVILDMVLNHAWGPSSLVRLWNEGDYGKPTAENPYLNINPKHDFNVGYDFNHESQATKYFVDRVNRYWLEEFNFDGYRFDLSKGFTQKNTLGNTSAWGQYDASRVAILKRMADQIWAVDDSAFVILEHFADNSEEKELSNYGMMLWGNMNHSYNEATMGYHEQSDFSGVSYSNRGWNDAHLVGYMESHDEERLMYKNLQFGNSSGGYDITDLNTALNRNKMAAAFFFTIPGPKLFWQFGELGYDISIDKNGRTGEKPIKWEYYSEEDRKKLYDTFRALIRLRNSHSAFTSEDSELSFDLTDAAKRMTISHPAMEVSIIGNFGITSLNKRPSFSQDGTWYEFFSGDTLNVAKTDTTISLAPGEFHIYTTKKFEQPAGNPLSGGNRNNSGDQGSIPKEFELHQNYPNPFNPTTTIPYDLPDDAEVTLEVYNILGRKIITRDLGLQTAGQNKEIPLDLSNLSSGLYIYRVRTSGKVSTRKMMLIK